MRLPAAVLLVLPVAAAAQAADGRPPERIIVGMAQHLVQEHFMHSDAAGHYHIEFDLAQLHPQPQPNYWLVIGGFVSDQRIPNGYGAAIRLICDDFNKTECWELDKLVINGSIILDKGKPL